MPKRLPALLPYLILLVLLLTIFHGLAFTDRILGRGDTYVFFYPYWTVRDAFLRAGQLPLWTPNLFMGAPLLADPQIGTLYPPNWLTIMLDAPNAVRISILLHVAWAVLGAYQLARRAVHMPIPGALVTGMVFGLGGYVGAHVEQINQLQGLAWFPWLFLLLHLTLTSGNHRRYVVLLGMALALQILSGHTQTVFISGVGMGVYVLASGRWRGGLLGLIAAGIVALVLAIPQLIPTLELIGQSGRSGGLSANAALSFSLNPFIAGRGLLPSYDGKLFSEYIAYVGVSGIMLAVVGAFLPSNKTDNFPHRRVWLAVIIVALFLAIGAYNPLNWLVVRLPGFDLFRVPARWLALFALGAGVLAGLGVTTVRIPRSRLLLAGGAVLFLMALSFLAVRVPEEINGPARPGLRTIGMWGIMLLITLIMLSRVRLRWLLPVVVFVELIAASWVMPYNDLVPPEIWSAQRLSISQMLAYVQPDENGLMPDGNPPGRMLSISGLFFDPGDKGTLSARYQALGMTPLEERYSFVAAKLKETLSPNLPLAWNIPTVDGFGGGLLPTRYNNAFMTLIYAPGSDVPGDGRLRENLALEACRGACVPEQPWLGMMDIRYLIVDKVFDVWHEGVSYDTNLYGGTSWHGDDTEGNVLHVLYTCHNPDETCQLERVQLRFSDGSNALVSDFTVTPLSNDNWLAVGEYDLNRLASAQIVPDANTQILGVTVVDTRIDTFRSLTTQEPVGWERVLSSDIKLYHRTDNTSRAWLVPRYQSAATDDEALALLQNSTADMPLVLQSDAENLPSSSGRGSAESVQLTSYSPTRVTLTVDNQEAGSALVLFDSYYPGWRATVNGQPTPIYRANLTFRAITLPVGESRVIFEYDPWWLPGTFILGVLAWIIAGGMLLVKRRKTQRE